MKWLSKFENHAFALLRIVAGFMFLFHGGQKVLGILGATQPPVGSQLWIGGVIELVGGILVMLGLWTRVAAFICSGEMAVAYVQFHWKLHTGAALLPIVNKGELALLYALVFLLIACKGSVMWSVDKRS